MNTETFSTTDTQTFMVDLRGNQYPCNRLSKRGQILFQVVFKTSYLYLTKATGADRVSFWTSIPEDPKLLHIVRELGEQIDKHFK